MPVVYAQRRNYLFEITKGKSRAMNYTYQEMLYRLHYIIAEDREGLDHETKSRRTTR